jgi:hypothetical protein
VPIHVVASTRKIEGCQNKTAILFCNNCAAHCLDDVLRKLSRPGILILTYPPPILQLFQVLDVLRFTVLKLAKSPNGETMGYLWWLMAFCDCFEQMRKQYLVQQSGRLGQDRF